MSRPSSGVNSAWYSGWYNNYCKVMWCGVQLVVSVLLSFHCTVSTFTQWHQVGHYSHSLYIFRAFICSSSGGAEKYSSWYILCVLCVLAASRVGVDTLRFYKNNIPGLHSGFVGSKSVGAAVYLEQPSTSSHGADCFFRSEYILG
jgi:hypothetical protein